MSRASHNRIQRCLAKKETKRKVKHMKYNNKCWDEVAQLEGALVGMLFSVKRIIPVMQNQQLMAKLDQEQVMKLAKIIDSDMARLKEELEAIQSKHKDKVGGSVQQEDIMEAISIGQEYQMLSQRFVTLVVPNVDRILQMAYDAAKELDKENGITDAEVIDVIEEKSETTDTTEVVEETSEESHE